MTLVFLSLARFTGILWVAMEADGTGFLMKLIFAVSAIRCFDVRFDGE